MPIHRLEELTWRELDALPRERTAVLVAVSPMEEHGTHLPLGVDAFNAAAFAQVAAEEFVARDPARHAVICPLIPLGTWTFDFIGSVWIRQRVMRGLVEDWGNSYARYGFRHLVVTNGHGSPGHVVMLQEACDRVTRKWRHQGTQMISPLGPMIHRYFNGEYGRALQEEVEPPLSKEDAEALPSDVHAGYFETSMMLHLRPELVRDEYRSLPPVTVPKRSLWFSTARHAGQGLGYLGYPQKARAEIGAAAMGLVRREVGALLDRMVAGEDVDAQARSPLAGVWFLRTDFWLHLGMATAGLVALVAWWLLRG